MEDVVILKTPIRDLYIIRSDRGPKFPEAITLLYNGGSRLLIDLGVSFTILEKAFSRLGLTIKDIEYIILTHLHPDHCKNIRIIKEKNEDVVIMLNELEARFSDTWEKFFEFYGFKDNKEIIDEWLELVGKPLGFTPFKVDENIKFYDVLEVDNLTFEFIPTPGHTIGHTSIKIGDVVVTSDIDLTNFPWYGHPSSSVEDFIESIELLMEMKPRYLISMHRGLIAHDTEGELRRYLNIIYERDKIVRRALEEGSINRDVGDRGIIYPRIYSRIIKFFEDNMVKKHVERVLRSN